MFRAEVCVCGSVSDPPVGSQQRSINAGSFPHPLPPSLSICVYLVNLIRRLENLRESLTHLCLCANCKHATAGNVSEEPVNQVQKTTLSWSNFPELFDCCWHPFLAAWRSHTQSAKKKKKISEQLALLEVSYHNNQHSFTGLDVERTISLLIYISSAYILSVFFSYKRGHQNERLIRRY